MRETWVRSLGREGPLEKEMATHSSILAWRIPWMEEPGWATVHGVTKSQTLMSDFTFTFHFHALEKELATTHSSVLAWKIPGMGAWWAAVYGVTQSWTRLTWLSSSSSYYWKLKVYRWKQILSVVSLVVQGYFTHLQKKYANYSSLNNHSLYISHSLE